MVIFMVIGCQSKQSLSESTSLDQIALKKILTEDRIKQMQEVVRNKLPYQGSLVHQARCDTLIALGYNVAENFEEKSTPYTKNGDYHLAFSYLEQAYKIDPKGTLNYYSWVMLYYFRDYERALKLLTEHEKNSNSPHANAWGENVNYLKGLALKQMGRNEEAVSEFSKYINNHGTYVDPYTYLYRGIVYLNLDNYELALKDIELLLSKDQKSSAAYYWKAEVLAKNREYAEALNNLRISLDHVKRGNIRTDVYMELFDMPMITQVEDKIEEIEKLILDTK